MLREIVIDTETTGLDHANGDRVIEISPQANLSPSDPQRQPSNVTSYVYDERGLLYTMTRGGLTTQFTTLPANADIPELNTIPNSPSISTATRRYDVNGNLTVTIPSTMAVGAYYVLSCADDLNTVSESDELDLERALLSLSAG